MKKLLILIALLALAACGGGAGELSGDAEPASGRTFGSQSSATAAAPATVAVAPSDGGSARPAPATAVDSTPGIACLGTAGQGLTCLTAQGEWQQFSSDNSGLGSNYISALAGCGQDILVAYGGTVARFDGSDFTTLPESDTFSSPEAVACAGNGDIWVAHFRGVSRFDGQAWQSFDAAQLGNQELVYDVRVGADGVVWVLTSNTIARFDGANWTVFAEGSGLDGLYFFSNLAFDGRGMLWASHSSGLLYFEDALWKPLLSDQYGSPQAMVIDPAGSIWLGDISGGTIVYDGNGWTQHSTANSDLSSDRVRALATDGNGRIWIGTEYGLNVVTADGWTVYRMDNADLSGNQLQAIAVVGGGPALPEVAAKEPGGLTGQLIQDGQPVNGASVEICVESLYSSFSGDTPCADQPLYFQATSDANGTFAFADIPPGLYALVAETSSGWAQLTTEFGFGSEMVPVPAGRELDLGDLTITSD